MFRHIYMYMLEIYAKLIKFTISEEPSWLDITKYMYMY